jgi:hydrogenase-4 component B
MAVLGFSGGLLHVLNHAIFKSLLFMGAGMVLHKTGTRSINALGGLLKNMKITGATFLIGSLAISGLPPFNGFVGEFFIYMGRFRGVAADSPGVRYSSLLAIVSLAIIGGLALACFTKVVGVVFQGEPRSQAAADVNEKGPAMLMPMVILAGACAVIGIYPGAFMFMALKGCGSPGPELPAVSPLNRLPGCRPTSPWGRPFSSAIIAHPLALRRIHCIREKAHRSRRHLGLRIYSADNADAIYRVLPMPLRSWNFSNRQHRLKKPIRRSRACFPEENRLPESGSRHYRVHLNRVVRPVLWLFDKLRWIQHGDIHLYIGYILLAIVMSAVFRLSS